MKRYFPKVVILTLLAAWLPAASAQEKNLEALEEQAFKQASALVAPSIVRIQTVGGLDRVGNVLTGTGPTTGVIVSEDGYIVSSAFNFASKPANILVQLPDGRRFPAKEIATDGLKMITLLKIDVTGLTPAVAADPAEIRVGQWALALGRTYDNAVPSVSIGIVSALNRIWGKAIQTDAKVSPVNYGGPLVDVEGKVMGLLVPLSPKGTGETSGVEWYDSGIGFAIPMQDVYDILDRLKEGEDLKPGLMGISFSGSTLLAGKPEINLVRVDSPADEAGLEKGDVITKVDDQEVARQADVKYILGRKYAGDKVQVSVKRGEETIEKTLVLAAELTPFEPGFLGILPDRIDQADPPEPGVAVRFVYDDSPASLLGLQKGDRVIQFNGAEIATAVDLRELVYRVQPGEEAELVYTRGGEETTVTVKIASQPTTVPADIPLAQIPLSEAVGENEEDAPKTGRFNVEMPAHEHSYWAYVPEDYNPAHSYGLIVWLHPGSDTMEATIIRQWQSLCDDRGFILVGPKAAEPRGWELTEAEFVKAATEEMIDGYNIDPARVMLHGFSTGGRFAWHMVFKERELFRGIAVVAEPLRTRPPENDPDFPLHIYMSCGRQDNLFRQVDATATGLNRLKYPTVMTPIDGLDHRYPADENIQEIARWGDSLDRI